MASSYRAFYEKRGTNIDAARTLMAIRGDEAPLRLILTAHARPVMASIGHNDEHVMRSWDALLFSFLILFLLPHQSETRCPQYPKNSFSDLAALVSYPQARVHAMDSLRDDTHDSYDTGSTMSRHTLFLTSASSTIPFTNIDKSSALTNSSSSPLKFMFSALAALVRPSLIMTNPIHSPDVMPTIHEETVEHPHAAQDHTGEDVASDGSEETPPQPFTPALPRNVAFVDLPAFFRAAAEDKPVRGSSTESEASVHTPFLGHTSTTPSTAPCEDIITFTKRDRRILLVATTSVAGSAVATTSFAATPAENSHVPTPQHVTATTVPTEPVTAHILPAHFAAALVQTAPPKLHFTFGEVPRLGALYGRGGAPIPDMLSSAISDVVRPPITPAPTRASTPTNDTGSDWWCGAVYNDGGRST